VKDNLAPLAYGLLLYALLGVAVFGYWPGLRGDLMLDDFENLAPLADLDAGITTLRDVLTTNVAGNLGRQVSMLSFTLDQIAHGGDVWFFKYTNLLLHTLCGTLIFWLTGRLVQGHALAPYRWTLAAWVTAMWLFTPLHVSTVLYVVQRMAQLATLFMLAGLLAYVIGRQLLVTRRRTAIVLIASTFAVWWPLATLSKENGALLPLLILLVEVTFFRFTLEKRDKQILLGIYALTLLVPLGIALVIFIRDPDVFLNGYVVRDFTLAERVLTQPRVLLEYIRQLIHPEGSAMGIYHDDYPKSTGLMSPPATLLAILVWLAVIPLAVRAVKNKTSPVFFGILFYVAGHLLESTIFPLELYFEHRNYLSSYGILLALGCGLIYAAQRFRAKWVIAVLAALLPALHAAASYQRIHTWSSHEQILFSALYTHPNSVRVHANLSVHYMNQGDTDRALSHLATIESLDPLAKPAVAVQRFVAYCVAGRKIPSTLYENLKQNLSLSKPTYTTASLKILAATARAGYCPQLDIDKFASVFGPWLEAIDPNRLNRRYKQPYWLFNIHLAQLLGDRGRLNQAIRYLDLATVIDPNSLEPDLIKFRHLLELGRINEAEATLRSLQKRDRHNRIDQSNAIRQYEEYLAEIKQIRERHLEKPVARDRKRL
jgi:tetratricopeptide (TPR) repeat protein